MSTNTIPVLLPMKNQIKNYDWGHPSVINEIVGLPSDGKPQAEMWMGVHPGGPSYINVQNHNFNEGAPDGNWKSLAEAISQAPIEFLGSRVHESGFENLPFLFKLIAAHKPLSIQCHPSLQSAKEGFARENAQGIPLNAPHRNYKDPNHKPEIVCALTGLWALSGFRNAQDIADDFRLLAKQLGQKTEREAAQFCNNQAHVLETAVQAGGDALSIAFSTITANILALSATDTTAVSIIGSILQAAKTQTEDRFVRMVQAASYFPNDSGLLFFFVLTLYHLLPGQALFVPAGILHAYVEGLAVEVMANSDNVLRGGLTPKYIDVPELLANLNPSAHETYMAAQATETLHDYAPLCPEFQLSRMVSAQPTLSTTIVVEQSDGPEVLFCTSGRARVRIDNNAPGGSEIDLLHGQSLFIRPWGKSIHIELIGELYRAFVPTFP